MKKVTKIAEFKNCNEDDVIIDLGDVDFDDLHRPTVKQIIKLLQSLIKIPPKLPKQYIK